MPKVPRDLNANELLVLLKKHFGYIFSHQKGSHIRLIQEGNPGNKITIPNHAPIKIGTLVSIINEIAEQNLISKENVTKILFDI